MAEKRACLMPWKQWIRSRTLGQLHKNARYVKSGCTLPKIAPSPAQGGKAITHPLTAKPKNVQTFTASGTFWHLRNPGICHYLNVFSWSVPTCFRKDVVVEGSCLL